MIRVRIVEEEVVGDGDRDRAAKERHTLEHDRWEGGLKHGGLLVGSPAPLPWQQNTGMGASEQRRPNKKKGDELRTAVH